MSGKLYGVGVGPGDPKLMTYLAVETIKNCPVIAVPADGKEHAISYKIASGIVKDMDQKECLGLSSPMTKDRKILEKDYQKVSEEIIKKLDEGKNVAYLTLGDPTVYSTYIYIQRIVKKCGYDAEIINGVPSFCAVAAKLGDSLADRSEQLHIIPSNYDIKEALKLPGNKILMKAASKLSDVKKILRDHELEAQMIENCGMEEERIYQNIDEMVCVITSNIFNQSFVHLTNGPIVWDIVTAGGHIIKRTCWNIKVRDEVIGGLFDWLTVEYICIAIDALNYLFPKKLN